MNAESFAEYVIALCIVILMFTLSVLILAAVLR